jgi:hypothetical protein
MKRTKLLLIAAFMVAIGSAFTTKNIHRTPNVRIANPTTQTPCNTATFTCSNGTQVCTDGLGNDYYSISDTKCVTPLTQQ